MYLVLTLKYVINESSLAFLLRKDGVEQQDQTSIITVQKLDDGGRLTLGYSHFFLINYFFKYHKKIIGPFLSGDIMGLIFCILCYSKYTTYIIAGNIL